VKYPSQHNPRKAHKFLHVFNDFHVQQITVTRMFREVLSSQMTPMRKNRDCRFLC